MTARRPSRISCGSPVAACSSTGCPSCARIGRPKKAFAEAAASYTTQGYTVIDEYPDWRDKTCVALRYLRTPDGEEATTDAVTDPAR
jgi:hypothetical protein